MTLLLNFYAELAGLVVTPGAVFLALLVLRNPHNPAWMKSEFPAQTASVVVVALIAGMLAWSITSLVDAGLHIANAALITMATIAASGCLLWFAFGIGERLRRADNGRSPFGQIHAHSTLAPRNRVKTPIDSTRSWPVHGKTHP